MKQKRTSFLGERFLRRGISGGLAIIGLWMFSLAASTPSTWLAQWKEDATLVRAALAAELGEPSKEAVQPGWERLLLSESPLLTDWRAKQAPEELLLSPDPEPVEPDDSEDPASLAAPESPDNIREKTLLPKGPEGYAYADGIYILNRTKKKLDVAALAQTPVNINVEGAQVLIMHTHGTEAYTQAGKDVYTETGAARTTDEQYNMIRVGDEVAKVLTEMGLTVIHDRGLYDYPEYNGSYDRSKAAVERYLKENPNIKIVMDIHRDALVGNDGTIYKSVAEINGKKSAQILLVMGSDAGGLSHTEWKQNLSLAIKLQQRMNETYPTLARPINLRSSRFNQQLTTGSILVEVGTHGNTLQEALTGASFFAQAAGSVLLELK